MFSIGFKLYYLGSIENRHQRTFHLQVIPKHLLQPLCLKWIPILQDEMVIKKETLHSSEVLDEHLTNSSQHGTSWIRLDVNNDVSFCNLLKVLHRVLSSPEDNFFG